MFWFKKPFPCLCPYKTMGKLGERPAFNLPEGMEVPAVDMGKIEPVVLAAPASPDFKFVQEQSLLLEKVGGGLPCTAGGASGAGGAGGFSGGLSGGLKAAGGVGGKFSGGLGGAEETLALAGGAGGGKLQIPASIQNMPVDQMQLGKIASLPVVNAQVKAATGIRLDAANLTAKEQASLDSLLNGSASLPNLQTPQLSAETQQFYASINQLQTCKTNTGVDFAYDAKAIARMEKTAQSLSASFAKFPAFPAADLAGLAQLSQLVQICGSFGIDITDPEAFVKLREAIINTTQNMPAERAAKPLPEFSRMAGAQRAEFSGAAANLHGQAGTLAADAPSLAAQKAAGSGAGFLPENPLGGAGAGGAGAPPDWNGISANLAAKRAEMNASQFFKADLGGLDPQAFSEKVCVPMQRAADATANAQINLTPEQIAICGSYAQARQVTPALKLMQNFDVSKLDMAPLADLPEIPNAAPLSLSASLGETTGSINKWEKCPQCTLA
jgi:hypothetical protein